MGGGKGGTVVSLDVNVSGFERMERMSVYLVTMWALRAGLYSMEDLSRWCLRSAKRARGLVNAQVCVAAAAVVVVMVERYGLQCE